MRFVLALVAALCAVATTSGAAPQSAPKVVLGYTPVAETVGAYSALKEGYFAKNGLNVQFLMVNNSAILANSLMAKSIDVASITSSVFLQAVDSGLDFVAISGSAVASAGRKTTGVLVREGVTVQGPRDFIGKKVAVSGIRSATHIEFCNWLTQNGVDYKKVTFLEAPFPAHNDLLKSGSIDATLSLEPFMSRAVAARTAHIVTYLSDKVPPGTASVVFIARRDWAEKNPALVRAFQQSIVQGINFTESHQPQAHIYIGEMLKLPADAAKQTDFGQLTPHLEPKQLQWWIDVMRSQRLTRTNIDPSGLVVKSLND